MNLWACATKATLQLVKMHTNSVTLHLWESLRYLNQFQRIPRNVFANIIHSIYFQKTASLLPRKPMAM